VIVRWLPRALDDRRHQVSYIFQRNPQAAVRLETIVRSQTEILHRHPLAGRIGRQNGTRELVIPNSSYVIIYRIDEKAQQIQILRLLHGAQQWPPEEE